MPAPEDLERRVDAVLEAFPAGGAELPGLIVAVSDCSSSITRAAGVADPWTRRPLRADAHLRVASNTKTIAATALLVLIDRGRLGLDDPVVGHLPELAWLEGITVRQALAMRTGLPDPFVARWERDGRPDVLDPHERRTALERVQELRDAPREHGPDMVTSYSNTNYLLVHLLLERLTGRRAATVIAELVLRPAGLGATHWPRGTAPPRPHASGSFGGEVVLRMNPRALFCDGALVSTVPDLARWAPWAAGGALLSPALHAERLRFVPTIRDPAWHYGLGLARSGRWIGHDGEYPGYATSAYHDPHTGITIAVGATRYDGEDPRSFVVFGALADALAPRSGPL